MSGGMQGFVNGLNDKSPEALGLMNNIFRMYGIDTNIFGKNIQNTQQDMFTQTNQQPLPYALKMNYQNPASVANGLLGTKFNEVKK